MAVDKRSVSFTAPAFEFAQQLVEAGEYPNVSAAVSGELAKAKFARDREDRLFEAEVQRRLSLPVDQWEPFGAAREITLCARAHVDALERG